MKILVLLLFLQTYYPIEDVPKQFTTNTGVPVAGGKVCITAAGTSTNITTYQDANGATPHSNPITLDSSGRPPGAGIFMPSVAYKLVLYAAGTGNTCNGQSVGALIKSVDNVRNAGAAVLSDTSPDNVRICSRFTGATAGEKIAACIADLPGTGGIADATGIEGAQTITSSPFTGVTKPVTLKIGAGQYTVSTNVTVPASVVIEFARGGYFSINNGSTLTVAGSVECERASCVIGAGSVVLQ